MISGENYSNFIKNNMFYIKTIDEGFNYSHIFLSGNYNSYVSFIKYIINTCKNSFIDFYFVNLKENEKQIFYNKGYKNILKNFNFIEGNIYYNINNLSDEILEFIIKISYDELLFSSFYFKSPDIILWTNYNKKWIIFFKNADDLKYIEEISKKFNLKIDFKKEIK